MQDRLDQAEPIFQSLVFRGRADRTDRARPHLFYGSHLARCELFQQAEQQLLSAVELVGDIRMGTWDSHPDDIIIEFIALYEPWGKPDKAEEYRRLRAESVGPRARLRHPDH